MQSDDDMIAGQEHAQSDHSPYPRSVIVGVVFLCAATAVLTVWNLQTRLRFDMPALGNGLSTVQEYTRGILDLEDEQLRMQDSDEDGLTDYEELRIYGTSPFIADTDSDRLTDAEEIKAGSDPNCPAGQTCSLALNGEFETSTTTTSPYVTSEIQAIANDPAAIRRLLIEGGVDARMLETIDDQTLQLLAQEAITATTQPTPEKLELIENLQPAQIRALLIEQGFDEQVLRSITDDQLMAIFAQAYAEVTSTPQTN